jgi:hypothetical protein
LRLDTVNCGGTDKQLPSRDQLIFIAAGGREAVGIVNIELNENWKFARATLRLENIALRHKLNVLTRSMNRPTALVAGDFSAKGPSSCCGSRQRRRRF